MKTGKSFWKIKNNIDKMFHLYKIDMRPTADSTGTGPLNSDTTRCAIYFERNSIKLNTAVDEFRLRICLLVLCSVQYQCHTVASI